MARKVLRGRYVLRNDTFLRGKSERDDPRAPFYRAMLDARTFEEYYKACGDIAVDVPTHKSRKITPHAEIVYALYRKWIVAA